MIEDPPPVVFIVLSVLSCRILVVSPYRHLGSTLVIVGRVIVLVVGPADTGGKGAFTQWVHGEFMVSSEAICPPNTHWAHAEYF